MSSSSSFSRPKNIDPSAELVSPTQSPVNSPSSISKLRMTKQNSLKALKVLGPELAKVEIDIRTDKE